MISKFATFTEMIDKTVSEILKGIGTSVPAHILEFDEVTQLAKIQIAIEFIDVKGNSFPIAPIVNVPVGFIGGDFVMEHQIDKGNEGLLIISQRCIDGWIENGGISPQTVIRKLNLQDGVFIPGIRSKINAITNFNNDGIMLRNKAGDHYVWLKNTGDILSDNAACTFLLSSSGSIKGDNGSGSFELAVNGDFLINGVKIDAAGIITLPDGRIVNAHIHLAGSPPGNTGPMV